MSAEYDVIVVGGGHNGLTAACYLQKSGLKTLVLERLNVAGGGSATEEVTLPGFKHNTASVFHGFLHLGPVYRDLELQKYGAEYIWPEAQLAAVFSDGRNLILYHDLDRTVKEIARFSKTDANTYRELAMKYRVVVENMIGPWFFNPPAPNSISSAAFEASVEGMNLMRYQLSSARYVVEELFESNELRSLLIAFIKEFGGSPNRLGFGIFVPMALGETHKPHGWALCKGGSYNLSLAMVKCLEASGGKVSTGAHVSKILVEGGRATGVQLQDGTIIKANKLVLTSLEPNLTFMKLIGEENLPKEFIPMVKRWRPENICGFTTHLALDEPLKWKSAAFNEDISRCLGILTVDNPQELVDDFAEIDMGLLPKYPRMFTAHPTQVDPTQAPAGKATALAWELAPYQIRGKEPEAWDEVKHEFAQRCIDVWDSYTTNMKKAILKVYAQSPVDTERRWVSMVHGGFNHGELSQDQMNVFRPFHEYKPYRTPFENLYMCGAATHPAGNLSGACGWNAVQVIAEDLKFKKKWWE